MHPKLSHLSVNWILKVLLKKYKIKFMANSNSKVHLLLHSYFVLSIFLLLFCNYSYAQETTVIDVGPTLFKNFQRDSILKMTIKTNTKQLVTKKYKEDWQPLTLTFEDKTGTSVEWVAKTRARGNIRKQVCYYPPLKIKLKKKWLVANEMDSSFNDLKLVVGCRKGSFYGKLLLKEYLIYQLYQALTDISFRTQLAEIEFIDTEDKWKPINTYAFFIENQDEMATRLNARCTKPKRLRSKYMYAEQLDKMNLFQYMIGNTDWSAVGSHNVRLIKCNDYPLPLPIPYDFDYAGLVNAPYAVHGEGINLELITDRLYLGMCRASGVLEKQIPLFQEKKATFYQIINDFPYLETRDKKQMIGYLDEFYDVLDNPNTFRVVISDNCRKEGR